jgi:hypothetical protein
LKQTIVVLLNNISKIFFIPLNARFEKYTEASPINVSGNGKVCHHGYRALLQPGVREYMADVSLPKQSMKLSIRL